MGVIFCIVLLGGLIVGILNFVDWRREASERLDSHYRRIEELDKSHNSLERSIATLQELYERKYCK
jgi:hypothetical protein